MRGNLPFVGPDGSQVSATLSVRAIDEVLEIALEPTPVTEPERELAPARRFPIPTLEPQGSIRNREAESSAPGTG